MRKAKKESLRECWDARRQLGRCHECSFVGECKLPEAEAGREKAKEIELTKARRELERAEERVRRAEEGA